MQVGHQSCDQVQNACSKSFFSEIIVELLCRTCPKVLPLLFSEMTVTFLEVQTGLRRRNEAVACSNPVGIGHDSPRVGGRCGDGLRSTRRNIDSFDGLER